MASWADDPEKVREMLIALSSLARNADEAIDAMEQLKEKVDSMARQLRELEKSGA